MPELPEVETTRRGIAQHILHQTVSDVIIRHHQLRWPISHNLKKQLLGQTIDDIERRGKYLLLKTQNGTAILHLGMSGNLRVLPSSTPIIKHDHVDIVFKSGQCLRFNDPRRFGCLLWTQDDPLKHSLLNKLGVEPLSRQFTGKYLFDASRNRKVAIKLFIMNAHIVVGVGNIYANEALFAAGIHPGQAAMKLSLEQSNDLVTAIKKILKQAIKQGGTTLRDFVAHDGKPGYFRQQLQIYGRAGEQCFACHTTLVETRLGQRSTVYCPQCQRKL